MSLCHFSLRRDRLRRALPHGSGALLLSAPRYPLRRGRHLPYLADSTFFYLTGSREPNTALLMTGDGQPDHFFFLPRCEREALFDGSTPNWLEQFSDSPMQIADLSQLSKTIASLSMHTLICTTGVHESHDRLLASLGVDLQNSLEVLMARQRWQKDEYEIQAMRRAGQFAARAHLSLSSVLHPLQSEAGIRDHYEFQAKRAGSGNMPYESIVAGGANSTILHHNQCSRAGLGNSVVLIDAGASHEGYVADMTRTHWIGQPPQEFLQIHEVVQRAQAKALESLKDPTISLAQVHVVVEDSMMTDLVPILSLKSMDELRQLFFHQTSHWIGLEVHDPDPDRLFMQKPLVAGACFSIEPGLYFRPAMSARYPRFSGIGIRIEDTVLKTSEGFEVLTKPANVVANGDHFRRPSFQADDE